MFMLATVVVLVVLVVREAQGDDATNRTPPVQEASSQARSADQGAASETSTRRMPTSREDSPNEPMPTGTTKDQTTTKPSEKTKTRPPTRLVLTATGGDTWLDARAGSEGGRVLYVGFVNQGQNLSLSAARIWIRFGGASNVAAELNGEPLSLRPGTYSALITARGLQFLGA